MKCNQNYFPIIFTFIFLLNTHEKNNIKIILNIFFKRYVLQKILFLYTFSIQI